MSKAKWDSYESFYVLNVDGIGYKNSALIDRGFDGLWHVSVSSPRDHHWHPINLTYKEVTSEVKREIESAFL